jgi:hypothetical protein
MKKILLVVTGLIALVGIIFAVKIVVARPNDPQKFVNTALSNSLAINSKKSTTVLQITADAGASGSGKFALGVTGVVTDATEYLPTLDYSIESAAEITLGGTKVTGKLKGEVKIVDEVFYGKFEPIELTGAPEATLAQLDAVNQFAGKWYSLSFAQLREFDPEIAATLDEQKARQLALRENLKTLFATTNLLLVKKMPISLAQLQPVEVVLNTNILTSDAFLDEIEKMFTPMNADNPLTIDATTREQIRTTLTALAGKITSTITLAIDRDSNFLRQYSAELDFALAELGIAQFPSGTVTITLDAQNSEIGDPQSVAVPTGFTELDPFELFPRPAEEVSTIEE